MGVQAIRLNPVDEQQDVRAATACGAFLHARSNGQSNGAYLQGLFEILQAFQRGEIAA